MKTLVIVLLVFLSLKSIGQTKEDTQKWIASKVESLGCSEYNKYKLTFEGGNFIIENIESYDLSIIKSIAITDIGAITFIDKKGECYWMVIKCKENNSCADETVIDKGKTTQSKKISEFNLIFSKSFKDDDLPKRMTKAINHLIELYGGTVVKETF